MKRLFRPLLLNILVIALLTLLLPGVSYGNKLSTLLTAAFTLSILNILLKPFIKIILLPFNLITFGLMGWFTNVIVLFLLSASVDEFTINSTTFEPGILTNYLPILSLSVLQSYLFAGIVYTFISGFASWVLVRKD